MSELTPERLCEASDTLVKLNEAFSEVQMLDDEQTRQAVASGGYCVIVALILTELAKNLSDGMEFYAAIRAAARGDMKLDEKHAEELQKIASRSKSSGH